MRKKIFIIIALVFMSVGFAAVTVNLYINGELVTEVNLTTATKVNAYAFNNCTNLTSINTEDWDTSKIISADYMFTNCQKLTKDSFTNFELPNVGSASHIFDGCTNLN